MLGDRHGDQEDLRLMGETSGDDDINLLNRGTGRGGQNNEGEWLRGVEAGWRRWSNEKWHEVDGKLCGVNGAKGGARRKSKRVDMGQHGQRKTTGVPRATTSHPYAVPLPRSLPKVPRVKWTHVVSWKVVGKDENASLPFPNN